MIHHNAFARARQMFEGIAAVMAAHPAVGIEQRLALDKLGTYESRGKGGKRPRHASARFVAQDKREAKKRRNRN